MHDKTDQFSFVLRPSKIQGIGVFATHLIKPGTKLRLFSRGEQTKWVKRTSDHFNHYFRHFCCENDGRISAPGDFGRMSVGWYLNHSDRPNTYAIRYIFFAKRQIRPDEELTVNYGDLEWEPPSYD